MSMPRRPPPIHMFLPPETVEMVMHFGSNFPADLAFDEEMTVLFSDMRGFTEMAERYSPRKVYATINASLAAQTGVIRRHGGSVNKFLGDGLLACFSGENSGEKGLAAVVEMLQCLPGMQGELPCPVGFGLHFGHVLFGVLGDEERREFTVIGDVPNTAARLCGIAHPFQALLTEAVVATLSDDTRERYCRFLRSQAFKGKKRAIDIYEVTISEEPGHPLS